MKAPVFEEYEVSVVSRVTRHDSRDDASDESCPLAPRSAPRAFRFPGRSTECCVEAHASAVWRELKQGALVVCVWHIQYIIVASKMHTALRLYPFELSRDRPQIQ